MHELRTGADVTIELCLFDLDNTLLRTDDLETQFRGQGNVSNTSDQYTNALASAFGGRSDRHLYTPSQLSALRLKFPSVRWGVFTRSPRHYANTVLRLAYPNFAWDAVVGYEDVKQTKPNPEGVWRAMKSTGTDHPRKVILVGDEVNDVVSAYRAGCRSVLDQSSWGSRSKQHWWALERVPDAIISGADQLAEVIDLPERRLPELEYLIGGLSAPNRQFRIDKINHFFPWSLGGGHEPIHVMGRMFGEYPELTYRRDWHDLTNQIHAHKNAEKFPASWIDAILRFVRHETVAGGKVVVTCIPFKPARKPRLEALLAQTKASYKPGSFTTLRPLELEFIPDVLAFKNGAVSSHGLHLDRDQRFANVGANLYVKNEHIIRNKQVLIFDDVVTTGASLLWAHRCLSDARSGEISCMSLTKAIGAG